MKLVFLKFGISILFRSTIVRVVKGDRSEVLDILYADSSGDADFSNST